MAYATVLSEHPQFDELDAALLHKRELLWNKRTGPRVGDWCRMPGEDKLRRFTHDWGDGLQTTWPQHGLGSFYFSGGGASYSGSLDPSLPKTALIDTGERKPARFWFFHHDHSRAHNGVHFEIECRVFEYRP